MAKIKQPAAASRQTTTTGKDRTAPSNKSLQPRSAVAKLTPEEVYRLIQESAYFKAKERGFAPGGEVQDWIEAEAEVRRRLEGRA